MTTRRTFLSAVGAGLAAGAVGRAAPSTQPNVLIVIGDDMTWRDCEPHGNREVKTPHMARLAREGMRFDHMFTATAMCAPTRQQLYTGMFPVRNGAYPNHSAAYPGVRSLPHHLKALGYRVGLIGKTHFKPRDHVYGCHTTRGIINGSECYPVRSVRSATHKYIRNLNHETAFTNAVTRTGRNSVFASWLEAGKTNRAAAARARAYQQRPAEELYDLRNDPWELRNAADDPKLADVKAELRKRLDAWMAQQGDLGNATEMKARERQGRGSGRKKKAGKGRKGAGKPAAK